MANENLRTGVCICAHVQERTSPMHVQESVSRAHLKKRKKKNCDFFALHARISFMSASAQALICHKLDLSSSISYRTIILGIFFEIHFFQIQDFFETQDTSVFIEATPLGLA